MPDFVEIIDGCRRHDPTAMRALYDETASMAMGICMRYANDRDQAQDFVQEGYIRVYERIRQLAEPEKARAWVAQIMQNVCLDYYRKRYRRNELLKQYIAENDEYLNLNPYAAHDIVEAMRHLTPTQRVVFNLCEVEGYSAAEAAGQLKCDVNAVRMNLCRAKKRLREILK